MDKKGRAISTLGDRVQIFLVVGLMGMSTIKFLIVDAASAILTITLWGGIDYLGGKSIEALRKDITRMEHVAVVIFAILIASGMVFVYFKNRLDRS